MHSMTRRRFHGSVLALVAATASPAFAQEAHLSIGMAAPITSLDPHEDSNSPNNAASFTSCAADSNADA